MEKEIINVPEKHLPGKPLTKQEFHDTAVERVHLIAEEFTNGFNFLRNYPKSVTVFGGNHFKEGDLEYIKARSLGSRIVKDLNYSVFTGGGPGVMEAANRGAFEAGGKSIGLTIELENHQAKNPYLIRNLGFHYFFSRKVCLSFSAEAYIFFPGGFGTLDEFFEIITLIQTRKIESVPIILVGCHFWNTLKDLMKKEMLDKGAIDKEDLGLFTITDDEDEVIEIIKKAPVHISIEFKHSKDDKI